MTKEVPAMIEEQTGPVVKFFSTTQESFDIENAKVGAARYAAGRTLQLTRLPCACPRLLLPRADPQARGAAD